MQRVVLVASSAAAATESSEKRLTIVNGCSGSPIWIAHIVAGSVGPDPQDVEISPGASAIFTTSLNGAGLSATRFWPKVGCDASGSNCAVGSSGGPGEGCVVRVAGQPDDYSNCAPPVDSKFEATFADPGSSVYDTVDMSLVDGYTLPFKLETHGGSCVRDQAPFTSMDCSDLSLRQCPTAEALGGERLSLLAVDPKTGVQGGCYSPCMRLTDDKWNSGGVAPDSKLAGPYCCAGSFGGPKQCNKEPSAILGTEYVQTVHSNCPAAYGYAYDDKTATIACSTSTEYTVTFYCPTTGETVV